MLMLRRAEHFLYIQNILPKHSANSAVFWYNKVYTKFVYKGECKVWLIVRL